MQCKLRGRGAQHQPGPSLLAAASALPHPAPAHSPTWSCATVGIRNWTICGSRTSLRCAPCVGRLAWNVCRPLSVGGVATKASAPHKRQEPCTARRHVLCALCVPIQAVAGHPGCPSARPGGSPSAQVGDGGNDGAGSAALQLRGEFSNASFQQAVCLVWIVYANITAFDHDGGSPPRQPPLKEAAGLVSHIGRGSFHFVVFAGLLRLQRAEATHAERRTTALRGDALCCSV